MTYTHEKQHSPFETFAPDALAEASCNPLPCPFCHAAGDMVTFGADDLFFRQCQNCGARGPVADHPATSAILWNFRNGFPEDAA